MGTRDKIPDIVFVFPENFPDNRIEEETSTVKSSGLDFRIIKKDCSAYASFEWIIPTAFGAYILKPYFDSFLSEAGKDHYKLLKKTLEKVVSKGKAINTQVIAADLSPNKLSKKYTQSFTVSLEFQTINNRHLKLLFDNELGLSDWNNALDQFLELMHENYADYPNDRLTIEIEKLQTKQNRMIYSIINPATKQLEFKDDIKMAEKFSQYHS